MQQPLRLLSRDNVRVENRHYEVLQGVTRLTGFKADQNHFQQE